MDRAGTSAAPVNASVPRTNARFVVMVLMVTATAINYLDRTVIGIAAPSISRELGLDAAMMGLVFSAFSWTYAATQIPGGIFLDRAGTRLTYALSLVFWSLCTLLQGMVRGLGSLLTLRFALGVAEAPCFPANSRILSTWFPQHERARANAAYAVGQYFGLGFLSPLLFWITAQFGWRLLFLTVGAIGLGFGVIWYQVYREPQASSSANQAELDYIGAGGGLAPPQVHTPFTWRNVRSLLRHRQIIGASIGQFAGNSTLVFFLTWFPTYLATARHMAWITAGFSAVVPYAAATVGVLVGGHVSDALLKWTGSANLARKGPIVTGLLLASLIVSANYVSNNAAVIAIMSVAFFGQGMVNLGFTVIADVAPKQLMGLTAGLFNLAANLAGIITPLVIGFIVSGTGSFVDALVFVGVVALIGVMSYVFVLGDIHRLEIDLD